MTTCLDCGAQYEGLAASCGHRVDALLALDHSRREPWGSRHGLAFAVFAVQHPTRYSAAIQAQSVEMLRRVYLGGEALPAVVHALSLRAGSVDARGRPPAIATRLPRERLPVTIADLGRFDAAAYPALLDEWCRSTLVHLLETPPCDGEETP